jgi:hypothetical protein
MVEANGRSCMGGSRCGSSQRSILGAGERMLCRLHRPLRTSLCPNPQAGPSQCRRKQRRAQPSCRHFTGPAWPLQMPQSWMSSGGHHPSCKAYVLHASQAGVVGRTCCLQIPLRHSQPMCCSDILSGARTARLNAQLVQQGLAYTANTVTAYPADRHACVSLLYALPASTVSLPAMQRLVRGQLDALCEAGPSATELQRVKKVRRCTCCLRGLFDVPL